MYHDIFYLKALYVMAAGSAVGDTISSMTDVGWDIEDHFISDLDFFRRKCLN